MACADSSRSRSAAPTWSACAARKAVIGDFASTTRHLSPGRRTTTSGRMPRSCELTRGHLLVEVAAGQHAGVLQDPAQLHLAPGAPDGGGVERAGQRGGLGPQRVGGGGDVAQALAELGELLGPVALEGGHLPLDPAEGVAQRGQHGGGLGVLAHRRLEVDHALTQQVALGGQGRGAPDHHDAGEQDGDDDTDEQTDECADEDLHAAHRDRRTDNPAQARAVDGRIGVPPDCAGAARDPVPAGTGGTHGRSAQHRRRRCR